MPTDSPSSVRRAFMSAWAMTPASAFEKRSSAARGVPAGANTP